MTRTHPFTHLLWPLCAALLLLPFGVAPQARPAAAASAPDTPVGHLDTVTEMTGVHNTPATAQPIGSGLGTWSEQVIGKISTSSDLDYYTFTLLQPASSVKITLDNLPADYDLALAADPDTGIQQGTSGLEDITNIGGSMSSIGGSMSSISANSGTTAELIDTYLWQPGTYYIAVGSANGAYSDTSSYTLTIDVKGSGMDKPLLPAPEVQVKLPLNIAVTTLYITNSDRMVSLYPQNGLLITGTLMPALQSLALRPPSFSGGPSEYGAVLDLAALLPISRTDPTIANIYAEWDAHKDNPLYANKVARLIDNLIKAATDQTRGGSSCLPSQTACTVGMTYGAASITSGTPFPNVKYIVLVGGDNVLPFFRVPDLTTLANEADYATYLASKDAKGVIDPASPEGAALKSRMLLTDNPYGADKPLRFQGFPFYLPNRAVGRLVESPEDINRYLSWQAAIPNSSYTIKATGNGQVPAPAFVTGYDFLNDEAQAISHTLQVGMAVAPIPANITGPIGNSWTRSDMEKGWFGTALTATVGTTPTLGVFSDTRLNNPAYSSFYKLFSLNSHFDHWQILPAVGASSVGGTFPAQRVRTPNYDTTLYPPSYFPGGYFGGTLGYSVGCHSGYNVIDSTIALSATNTRDPRYNLYASDFAQAFNKQAGSWIGNTGYGYGTADGIDYSERLALLLTQELARDVQVDIRGTPTYAGSPIGLALAHAKQRYMRNSATLSAYDAKALTIMTLYGLPFIHVLMSSPLASPPEVPQIGPKAKPVPTESNAPAGLPVNSAGRMERTITVTIGIQPSDYVGVPRTGSKELKLTEQNYTVTDSFVQAGFITPTLRVFNNNQAGLPTLPTFAYDISALSATSTTATPIRLKVRDVVFQGGEYAPTTGFNPQITKIVTDTDTPITGKSDEPTFTAGVGIWYPDKFFGFSSVGAGGDQLDQLTATAAQFKADAGGVTGQLRAYTKMVFKVYYIDPNAPNASAGEADTTPPTIQSVQIGQITPSTQSVGTLAAAAPASVKVVAIVDKGALASETGVDLVSGVYVLKGTTWTPVSFSQPNPVGDPQRWEATIPLQLGQVRVIVSAADKAGNVSYYTAKGTFSLSGSQVFMPLVWR